MKSREELIEQQEKLLEVHEKVKDMLEGYPNVVDITIGIKEKDGKLTDEGCIKIFVSEKKKEKDLDPEEVIPKEVNGIKTDVVVKSDKTLLAVCAEDTANYRPIKGGIRISNPRVGGSGTLGCMAQLNSDNSWVILSNHHVLYGSSGQDADDVGQPYIGCSWCCKTNIIAKNINKNAGLDCAIAKVNDDIAISNIIEEIGNISGGGAVAAVNGERVRKRGSRTGYTSGTISSILPRTKHIIITPNAAGGPANDPGGCTSYVSGSTIFAFYGDSGSVVVNDNNEVIGLLYAIDTATETLGYANDILQIRTAMAITIKTTSSNPGVTPVSGSAHELMPNMTEAINTNEGWIAYLQNRLDETTIGRKIKEIINKHQVEVLKLVQKHRPVTIVWHRKQGPSFVAAFVRSLRQPEYNIPSVINRVTPQNLLMSMASVLDEHGSDHLREDIVKYSLDVIQLVKEYDSVEGILQHISDLDGVADVSNK